MSLEPCRLLVFAKAPIPGEVKTRLAPFLGASAAAALHQQLVLHCLAKAIEAGIGPVELWCSPSPEHPFFPRCAERFKVTLQIQTDGDLGMRMGGAFQKALQKAGCAVLIGTDCPGLAPQDLREARALLQRGFHAVLSPVEDGGYALIGLRQYAPELFTNISWGTDSVLQETRKRLRRLGWRWHELAERWDVDRPEDIERLKKEGYVQLLSSTLPGKEWFSPDNKGR